MFTCNMSEMRKPTALFPACFFYSADSFLWYTLFCSSLYVQKGCSKIGLDIYIKHLGEIASAAKFRLFVSAVPVASQTVIVLFLALGG